MVLQSRHVNTRCLPRETEWRGDARLGFVVGPFVMDELDGHGRYAPSSDRVPHDHHLNVFIVEGFGPPASYSLLREQAVKQFGVLIQLLQLRLGFAILRGRRLDNFTTEEFFDRAIFGFLPLGVHKLSGSYSSITQELVAAGELNAVSLTREYSRIVCNIENQDNAQVIHV